MFLVAAVVLASCATVPHDHSTRDQRPIATRAPYPEARADSVHRPGFNGRLWLTTPIIGGTEAYATDSGNPGAEAYGAAGNEHATVYARVGHVVVGISPWHRIDTGGLKRLESARNFWLKERGYTGGVRTFVNDAYLPRAEADASTTADEAVAAKKPGLPEPRATIKLPADIPRNPGRLRVDAGRVPGQAAARVSWPESAPKHLAERRAETTEAAPMAARTTLAAK